MRPVVACVQVQMEHPLYADPCQLPALPAWLDAEADSADAASPVLPRPSLPKRYGARTGMYALLDVDRVHTQWWHLLAHGYAEPRALVRAQHTDCAACRSVQEETRGRLADPSFADGLYEAVRRAWSYHVLHHLQQWTTQWAARVEQHKPLTPAMERAMEVLGQCTLSILRTYPVERRVATLGELYPWSPDCVLRAACCPSFLRTLTDEPFQRGHDLARSILWMYGNASAEWWIPAADDPEGPRRLAPFVPLRQDDWVSVTAATSEWCGRVGVDADEVQWSSLVRTQQAVWEWFEYVQCGWFDGAAHPRWRPTGMAHVFYRQDADVAVDTVSMAELVREWQRLPPPVSLFATDAELASTDAAEHDDEAELRADGAFYGIVCETVRLLTAQSTWVTVAAAAHPAWASVGESSRDWRQRVGWSAGRVRACCHHYRVVEAMSNAASLLMWCMHVAQQHGSEPAGCADPDDPDECKGELRPAGCPSAPLLPTFRARSLGRPVVGPLPEGLHAALQIPGGAAQAFRLATRCMATALLPVELTADRVQLSSVCQWLMYAVADDNPTMYGTHADSALLTLLNAACMYDDTSHVVWLKYAATAEAVRDKWHTYIERLADAAVARRLLDRQSALHNWVNLTVLQQQGLVVADTDVARHLLADGRWVDAVATFVRLADEPSYRTMRVESVLPGLLQWVHAALSLSLESDGRHGDESLARAMGVRADHPLTEWACACVDAYAAGDDRVEDAEAFWCAQWLCTVVQRTHQSESSRDWVAAQRARTDSMAAWQRKARAHWGTVRHPVAFVLAMLLAVLQTPSVAFALVASPVDTILIGRCWNPECATEGGAKLRHCSRCQCGRYCTIACQKQDYASHATMCKLYGSLYPYTKGPLAPTCTEGETKTADPARVTE